MGLCNPLLSIDIFFSRQRLFSSCSVPCGAVVGLGGLDEFEDSGAVCVLLALLPALGQPLLEAPCCRLGVRRGSWPLAAV